MSTRMYEERELYAPIIIIEHKTGSFSLMLTDTHMVQHTDLFNERGYEGGGYDWCAIAHQSVRAFEQDLEGRFGLDPEAGMFVAYGEDLEALQKLAGCLHRAFHDRTLLAQLIQDADPDWFD